MRRGFTLLEMLVASLIMAIAVVGLLSGVSSSLRNADRVKDYDRAVMLARAKMDALLIDYDIPRLQVISGEFDPSMMGGARGGWRARCTIFEVPPRAGPATTFTERIELEVWWMSGASRRQFLVEGFRRNRLVASDMESISKGGAEAQ
jgi:general secretion pathway protein I